jgi:hypothetical protein
VSNATASLATLGAEQSSLIARSREYLAAASRQGVDVALHPDCYLSGWSNVRGNARLLCLAGERRARVKLAIRRVKDALNVMRHAGLETAGAEQGSAGFELLVLSWCRNTDFTADGEYRDRYFRTSSRATPRALWLTLATDEHRVAKRDRNVQVLHKRADAARFSPALLAREFTRSLRRGRADGRLPALSGTVTHAERIIEAVRATLRAGSFRALVLPYEAQPFQQGLLRECKRVAPDLRTVGYLHSALPPLPADLAFREGAPDVLLVHGSGQIDILERELGWPRERLRAVPALRFRADDESSLAGFVFLPMNFAAPETIVKEFRAFVAAAPAGSLAPLAVRNHPVMRESRRHLQLQEELEAILRGHADRFGDASGAEPLSVFIGATAAIVEALERGVAVVHICSQPLTEAHTPDVWRGFEVERLGKCLFRYRIRERGAYIAFGSGSQTFDEVIGKGS